MSQEQRIHKHIDETQELWNTLSVRIAAIKNDLAIELDGERKVVLQKRLADLERRRGDVEAKLKRLEAEPESAKVLPEHKPGDYLASEPIQGPVQPTVHERPKWHKRILASLAFLTKPDIWWPKALIGLVLASGIVILFLRPIRCLLEHRISESIAVLIVALAGAVATIFAQLLPTGVKKVALSFLGGIVVALLLWVLVAASFPSLAEDECFPTTRMLEIVDIQNLYVDSDNNLWATIYELGQPYRLYVWREGVRGFAPEPHPEYYWIESNATGLKDRWIVTNVNSGTVYCIETRSKDGMVRYATTSYLTGSGSKSYSGSIYTDAKCPFD